MNKISLLLLLILNFQLIAQDNPLENESIKKEVELDLSDKISNYEIIKLPVQDYFERLSEFDGPQEIILNIGKNDVLPLQLVPEHDLIDRQVINTTSKGLLKNEDIKVFPYKGHVLNGTAYARLTVSENMFYLYVQGEGFSRYIEPLRFIVPGAEPDLYIVYYGKDAVMPKGDFCASTATKQMSDKLEPEEKSSVMGLCYEVELGMASDFLMYDKYNSSTVDVIARNVGVMNNVQGNYDDEFADELQFVIVEQYVSDCSTCDPWTASTDVDILLPDFRSWGPNGFSQTHDIGHLWSARDFDGSTIGYAYVGVVCTGSRYAILEDFSNNATFIRVLTSHETGHNFDAIHDASGSSFIMAPSVNGSTTWSATSISDIEAHYNSRTCLDICAPPAPPVSNFSANLTNICPGASIQFFDETQNSPTSWNWTFSGGSPASSTNQNPVVTYNNTGVYNVTLVATNDTGNDTETKNGYIIVDSDGYEFLINDDFSSGLTNWTVTNPDNSTTWQTGVVSGSSGSSNVAWIDNFDYNNGVNQLDGLQSGVIDLSGRDEITLELEYAYARYNNNNSDRFRIWASTDGGNTFTDLLFDGQENGSGNFASHPDLLQAFVPTDAGDWCVSTTYGPSCISLDLSSYEGQSQFAIRLENVSDYGNNLYIDNVNLVASCFINEPPIANFISDVSSGCSPLLVNFEDQSFNSPDTWQWSFPGGTPNNSQIQNPVIIYETAGVYPVTLTVTNEAGSNEITFSNFITVLDVPVTNFNAVVNGPTVNFVNNSIAGDTYLWDFGNGQSSTDENPIHNYTEDGTFTVTLLVTNVCGTTSFSQTITIATQPFANFTQDVVEGCASFDVQFTNTSSENSDSFEWSFPGGSPSNSTLENPVISYTQRGVYDVSLTAINESGTNTYTSSSAVITNDVPETDFNFNLNNNTASFTNLTQFADSYFWDFGDNMTSTEDNPVHIYDGDGEYTVTLVASNACGSFTITQELVISNLPFANFTAIDTEGCAEFEVQFQNNSSSNSETFLWSFEGGTPSTSTQENPVVTYEAAGEYDVQLVVSNEEGSDELTLDEFIIVGDLPQADYSFSNNDLIFSFTNESVDGNSYLWDFGDNETSFLENPVHTYNEDGNYTVTLTVFNDCGQDEFTLQINAVTAVSAGFNAGVTDGCADFIVQFSNTSSANATDFEWSFPGGTPNSSTEEEPVVTYSQAGTYSVTLIASNDGFTDEVTEMNYIVVNDIPEASFTSISNMLTVDFMNTSTNANSYLWDFGDNETSALENPTHVYDAYGTYDVTLTAYNECGEIVTETEVLVSSFPVANFTSNVNNGCTVAEIQFEDLSSTNATEWLWTFEGGNPSTSTAQNPVIEYETDGVFDVSLTVSNESGSDTQTFEDYITINTLPQVIISSDVNGNVVAFEAESTNTTGYLWTVSSIDEEYTISNPEISFPADGVYTVELQSTNECGTVSTTTAINITAYPDADFEASFTEGCAPAIITFDDMSEDDPTSFEWTFEGGNPSVSDDENPVVEYTVAGNYNVELIVENQYGSDTVEFVQYINLVDGPVANFEYLVTEGEVDFTNTSTGTGTISWDFGDNTGSSEENPTHTYDVTGDYIVTLIIDNGMNCQDTIERLVSVMINSINEIENTSIDLYPNPNTGSFVLEINSSQFADFQYSILDVAGRELVNGIFVNTSQEFQKQFNLDVSSGLYFMKITKGDENKIIRFVKQ